MNENLFGFIWLLVGYLILIMTLGTICPLLGQMKGMKTVPGFLGLFLLVGALVIFTLLKNEGKDARQILYGVCLFIPLMYLINIAVILLRKKGGTDREEYRRIAIISLAVFGALLLIWGIGLIITNPWAALNDYLQNNLRL